MFTFAGLFGGGVTGMGYTMGGVSIAPTTVINGFAFANETTFSPSATLSQTRELTPAAVSSSYYGYLMGGTINYGAPLTSMEKISFNSQTTSVPSCTLSVPRVQTAGVNGLQRGYAMGGNDTTGGGNVNTNVIDGVQFDTDTGVAPSATLATARISLAGVSSADRGYSIAGYILATVVSAEIDGIQFSNEAAINPSAAINTARRGGTGVNSFARGYLMGGSNDVGSVPYAYVDGIQFSDESAIVVSASLTTARQLLTGMSAPIGGYAVGGSNVSNLTSIERMLYSSEAISTISATLGTGIFDTDAVYNSGMR
jgi:hypothetical protein